MCARCAANPANWSNAGPAADPITKFVSLPPERDEIFRCLDCTARDWLEVPLLSKRPLPRPMREPLAVYQSPTKQFESVGSDVEPGVSELSKD